MTGELGKGTLTRLKVEGVSLGATSFWWLPAVLLVAFWGEPDIVDAVVFHLTGVQTWVTPVTGVGR